MKSLLITITFSFVLLSCTHLNEVKSTDKKNIIEVRLTNSDREPKIGQSVKVFNMVLKSSHRSSKSDDFRGFIKEHEIKGKIVEVISKELIRVELDQDFQITEKTHAEY
jgi:hypothetical protein